MAFFDLFKKGDYNLPETLKPQACSFNISSAISNKIDTVNWAEFHTAYGNAEQTIPGYLKNIFCPDPDVAMNATHQLWCSLCHQHAFISTAALPSYDILKIGLIELNSDLKAELLDIFQGFAYCSCPPFTDVEIEGWKLELRQKLREDILLFKSLSQDPNEYLALFASNILSNLSTY